MEIHLLRELLVASVMVAITVVTHVAGLAGLLAMMRSHQSRFSTRRVALDQVIIILGVAFGLFALHAIEIWAYAFLYLRLTDWPTFEQALYFSTTTYTTIGYGDVTLPPAWRVLGAIEGANGIILLGWSTAFFVSVVGRIRALEQDWSPLRPPPSP